MRYPNIEYQRWMGRGIWTTVFCYRYFIRNSEINIQGLSFFSGSEFRDNSVQVRLDGNIFCFATIYQSGDNDPSTYARIDDIPQEVLINESGRTLNRYNNVVPCKQVQLVIRYPLPKILGLFTDESIPKYEPIVASDYINITPQKMVRKLDI